MAPQKPMQSRKQAAGCLPCRASGWILGRSPRKPHAAHAQASPALEDAGVAATLGYQNPPPTTSPAERGPLKASGTEPKRPDKGKELDEATHGSGSRAGTERECSAHFGDKTIKTDKVRPLPQAPLPENIPVHKSSICVSARQPANSTGQADKNEEVTLPAAPDDAVGWLLRVFGESTGAGRESGDNGREGVPKQGAGQKEFTSAAAISAGAVDHLNEHFSGAEVPRQASDPAACLSNLASTPTPPMPTPPRSRSPPLEDQDTVHFGDIPIFKEDSKIGLKQRTTTVSVQHEYDTSVAPRLATASTRPAMLLWQPQAQTWVPRSNNGVAALPMCAGVSSGGRSRAGSVESSTRSVGSAGGLSGTPAGAGWGTAGISAASSGWSQQSTHLSAATTTASPSWNEKVVIFDRFRWPGVRPDQPGFAAPRERDSMTGRDHREQGRGGRGSCWRDVREQARAPRDRDSTPGDTGAVSFKRQGFTCSHTSSWTSAAHSQASFTSRQSLKSDSLIERINLDLLELDAYDHGSHDHDSGLDTPCYSRQTPNGTIVVSDDGVDGLLC